MLRVYQNTSPAGAKRYYATSDYYAHGNEQELIGHWSGRGAERLGLSGTIGKAEFDRLCDNLHPSGTGTLTQRIRNDRTVGYDFNFNAPKSVSLLYGLYQDPEILAAFRAAVDATMHDIEAEMKTRVRRKGQDEDRTTGNFVRAEFVHFTARPVKGVSDPSLHAHNFVFNSTYDPVEQQWKAGQFRFLKRDANYYEALFHSRLAGKLHDLGFGIVRSGRFWEVAGVSAEVIRRFSRHTQVIEAKAKELGIHSAEAKSELAATTREAKNANLTWLELQADWRSRLSDAERATLEAIQRRTVSAKGTNAATPAEALRHAALHVFERESVVREKQLLEEALRFGVGSTDLRAIHRELKSQGIIRRTRDGEALVTTPEVLAEERAMLAFARDGRGTCKPLAPDHVLVRDWLNDDQQAAVRHVLESGDRVVIVRGLAGTGKSTLLHEVLDGIGDSRPVAVAAPTAQASRGSLRTEGIDADTLQKFLVDKEYQSKIQGGVLILDEAGLAGSRDLAKAFAIAAERQARVLLLGDSQQHRSVPRGAALKLLETQAGIVPAQVKEIRRQSGAYKEAVADLAEGRTRKGFDQLDARGWIAEFADGTQHQHLAREYADAVGRGEKVLVVSPSHREGTLVSQAIREELKRRGLVDAKEQVLERLVSLNYTEAQRGDIATYRAAELPLRVQFLQNVAGFVRGTRADITGVVGDAVTIRTAAGKEGTLPLNQPQRFEVYRPERLTLAAGDLVRITQNGVTEDRHSVHNGTVYRLRGFTPHGDLLLDNDWRLAGSFGHLANGYVVTSQVSQGKTVDRVLLAASTDSLRASNQATAYVALSRGRLQAKIFTDDKVALREALARPDRRLTATELVAHDVRRRAWWRQPAAHLQRMAQRAVAYASRLADTALTKAPNTVRIRGLDHER